MMKKLLALLVFALSVSSVNAAGEIGVVDNGRLIDEYQGSKDAQNRINQVKENFQKTLTDLEVNLNKALQDKNLSEAQKLQKRKEAQDKVESEKRRIDQMVTTARSDIESKLQKAILEEAKSQGLSMVVAKNVTFYGGKDITNQVLTRLNK